MPPKTPPKKTDKDAMADDRNLLERMSSTEGVSFPITWVYVICSDRKSAKDQLPGVKCANPENYTDYVDVYVDGKLVCEGEPQVSVSNSDGKDSDGYTYYCEEKQYVFSKYGYDAPVTDVTIAVHSKKKGFLSSEYVVDKERLNKEHSVEIIHYYNGKEVFRTIGKLSFENMYQQGINITSYDFDEKKLKKHIEQYGRIC